MNLLLKNILFLVTSATFLFAQPDDSQNRFLLGQGFEQMGDYARALTQYDALYRQQPDNVVYFQALNRVLLQLKDYARSEEILRARLAAAPEDINLYGMLGKTYYLWGKEAEAFNLWDSFLAPRSAKDFYFRAFANFALDIRVFDKAIEYLKRGKAVSADPLNFSYDLANLYALTMRFPEAAAEYAFIVEADPVQLRGVEARVLQLVGKPDALDALVTVLEKNNPAGNPAIAALLASVCAEGGRYDKALIWYTAADAAANDEGAMLFNFAQRALANAEYAIAARAYAYLLDKHPGSALYPNVKIGYIRVSEAVLTAAIDSASGSWKPLRKTAVPDSAAVRALVAGYEDVMRLYPNSEAAIEAMLQAGKLLLLIGAGGRATELFTTVANSYVMSRYAPEAVLLLAGQALRAGNTAAAEAYYNRLLQLRGALPENLNAARYGLALLAFYRGNFTAARQQISAVLEAMDDRSANDALELMVLVNPAVNDSTLLARYAEGELLIRRDDFAGALSRFQALARAQQALLLKPMAQRRVVELYIAVGDYTAAIAAANDALADEHHMQGDDILFYISELYLYGLRNSAAAAEQLGLLLLRYPDSVRANDARDILKKLQEKVM